MKTRNLLTLFTVSYLIGMVLFWFMGKGTDGWNTYFYALEKIGMMTGFLLLAIEARSRYVVYVSIYLVLVSLFLLIYYVYCLFFGHSNVLAVSSFIGYSLLTVLFIKNTVK